MAAKRICSPWLLRSSNSLNSSISSALSSGPESRPFPPLPVRWERGEGVRASFGDKDLPPRLQVRRRLSFVEGVPQDCADAAELIEGPRRLGAWRRVVRVGDLLLLLLADGNRAA